MEVKRCPFCGEKAEVRKKNTVKDGAGFLRLFCECSVCGASSRTITRSTTERDAVILEAEELAVSLWNRRAG